MRNRLMHFYFTFFCLFVLSACSTITVKNPRDPWEGLNRKIFKFNEKCDKVIMRPVAEVYEKVIPRSARLGISNFYSNLGVFPSAVNKLLQGNIIASAESLMRFMVNLTFGLGGLKDIATQVGLPYHQSDFGMTLSRWGVPSGPYLILPLVGPSTLRDAIGAIPEWSLSLPITYIQSIFFKSTLFGIFIVNARATLLSASDFLSEIAFDQYSFLRDAYLQRRDNLMFSSRAIDQKFNSSNKDQEDIYAIGDYSDEEIDSYGETDR